MFCKRGRRAIIQPIWPGEQGCSRHGAPSSPSRRAKFRSSFAVIAGSLQDTFYLFPRGEFLRAEGFVRAADQSRISSVKMRSTLSVSPPNSFHGSHESPRSARKVISPLRSPFPRVFLPGGQEYFTDQSHVWRNPPGTSYTIFPGTFPDMFRTFNIVFEGTKKGQTQEFTFFPGWKERSFFFSFRSYLSSPLVDRPVLRGLIALLSRDNNPHL